jgi:hypothetical protein
MIMDKENVKEGEVLGTGEQLVAQGATLVRLENTTQMSVAIQRPRDEREILRKSLAELDIYPSLAKEALYSKPVGKDPETGKQRFADGLSIRAAESLGNRWQNSAYACEISEETDEYIILAGVFMDYETNTRHVFPMRVSKSYRSKQGQMVRYSSDRLDTVIAAHKSKLLRETILRSLPAGLKAEYEKKVRELLTAESPEVRRQKMVLAFKKFGIDEAGLEKIRGGRKIADFTHDDLDELIGVFNALKEGEITVDSLFGTGKEATSDKVSERFNLKGDDKK